MTLTLIVLGIVLLAALAGIALTIRRFRTTATGLTAEEKSKVHVRWHEIEQRAAAGGPSQYRQAIINADTLVDFSLKRLGVGGDTMGERLRNSAERFSDLDGLWVAHKLRNQLVHEIDRELLSFEAKQNLDRFKRALTDLGAL